MLEEINRNMYLMLVPTNESKENFKKYKELWIKIKDLVRYMTNKLNSDDKLPLNKTKKIPAITIVVRAVFRENSKYYPQVFLDECLYEI